MSPGATLVRPRRTPRRLGPRRESLETALTPVREDLEAVSVRLLEVLEDPVARTVGYLITAGGKRLRPALVLLCGGSGLSANRRALVDAATGVELIHTATLIHDDIIDRSPRRRHQATFHYRWGTERAVLMGDYLYATAFTIFGRLGVPALNEIIAQVCQQLSRGELREVEARTKLDLTEAEYLSIIKDKTASLINGCCRIGAVLGGAAPDAIEGLATFGENFGLAFQIIDDCLDLTGDPQQLGKAIHADLDKGTLSLPLIYLAQDSSSRECRKLFGPLASRPSDPRVRARLATAAQASGAVARAQARARRFMRAAKAALAEAPMDGFAEAYQHLAAYAVIRRS